MNAKRSSSLLDVLHRFLWLFVCGVIALAAFYAYQFVRLPTLPEDTLASPGPSPWPKLQAIEYEDWSVFMNLDGQLPKSTSSLAARLRLAGTFFSYTQAGSGSTQGAPRAIIDDLQKGMQYIIKENEEIDSMKVLRIFRDRVVIRSQGRDEELWLSFSGGKSTVPGDKDEVSDRVAEDLAVEGDTPYGRRVGVNRWVLSRAKVMGYYQELLDDPERLAQIYLSLKPDYNESQKIEGYFLGVEGEGAFFDAMGLKPGDVIRKANSVPMTSQRRAEVFLSEFVNDRLSAFVLDIEREGEPEKLVYLLR